eukprot:TRINITY_DN13772_c0_g1_i5.p1 TRINITY_DN13772_c0_g1~~TRINITY_DN13772_c0_g1_i5.p1  ORF type:complete len:386 (+),score=70.64 TRINITY_DN13772_c0_g1_i5:164-1321(+)
MDLHHCAFPEAISRGRAASPLGHRRAATLPVTDGPGARVASVQNPGLAFSSERDDPHGHGHFALEAGGGRETRSASSSRLPSASRASRGCSWSMIPQDHHPASSSLAQPRSPAEPVDVSRYVNQGVPYHLSSIGPASAATTQDSPSDAFALWLEQLERVAEERLLHEARRRFSAWGPHASLDDFRAWLRQAASVAEEHTLQAMRRAQLRTWLLCVAHRRRALQAQVPAVGPVTEEEASGCSTFLPEEVRERVDLFIGSKHVWGPIHARRARAIAESSLRQLRRCEGILRAAALAALVARYVHPAVVRAAEAGHMHCATDMPTDDVALQALFQVSAESGQDVGTALAAHLALDGFEVDPKYHDPEYGLWRGFWVDKCNRLRLTVMW